MNIRDIVDMTQAELEVKERDLRQELFNLRMQSRVGQVEKPSRLRDIRRDIARVLTVLSRKAPAQSPAKEKAAAKA